ncbi:MAG: sugar ABC transporter ATP-binding protein, partial [Candidatus Promineifilaceae bacterium]
MNKAVFEMHHISKRFGATQALDDVDLTLNPGEVHALIGENGAGKSTLIKIMTGIYQPDQGEILLDGRSIQVQNSQEAQAHGIAAIYQEPMVFPDLNVAENIFISHRDFGPLVSWRNMFDEAEKILDTLDIHLDVRQPARGLPLAAQQAVEIAKAISLDAHILIMDEPTASLSIHEVNQLFKLVHHLRDQGVAILFIGHRLEEVFEIADRITVLRDGKWVSTNMREDVTEDSVIRDMVGREVGEFYIKTTSATDQPLIKVEDLSMQGIFSDVSLEVNKGEVLGFAGLVGSR